MALKSFKSLIRLCVCELSPLHFPFSTYLVGEYVYSPSVKRLKLMLIFMNWPHSWVVAKLAITPSSRFRPFGTLSQELQQRAQKQGEKGSPQHLPGML